MTHTLAHASTNGLDPEAALKDFTDNNKSRYHTPVAEWLHHVLRPMFREQFPDDDAYDTAFDRTEVLLGLLAQDVVSQRQAANGGYGGYVRWFGRSTWRAAYRRGNPLDDLIEDSNGQGPMWPPLVAGLFGGNLGRARIAVDAYSQRFDEIVRQRKLM